MGSEARRQWPSRSWWNWIDRTLSYTNFIMIMTRHFFSILAARDEHGLSECRRPATPALAGNTLYLRTASALFAFGK